MRDVIDEGADAAERFGVGGGFDADDFGAVVGKVARDNRPNANPCEVGNADAGEGRGVLEFSGHGYITIFIFRRRSSAASMPSSP